MVVISTNDASESHSHSTIGILTSWLMSLHMLLCVFCMHFDEFVRSDGNVNQSFFTPSMFDPWLPVPASLAFHLRRFMLSSIAREIDTIRPSPRDAGGATLAR